MAPIPHVAGPMHFYCGVGASKAARLLGTTEVTPRLEFRPSFKPYFNSIYSTTVPMDESFLGEEAFVIGDFNRWDEAVYAAIQSRPNAGGTRGTQAAGDLGSLMVFEGLSYPLWLLMPYATAKAAYAGDPPGVRFLNAYLAGPDTWDSLNMEPSKRRLIFHAVETVAPGANNTTVSQLYDFNVTGLPAAA